MNRYNLTADGHRWWWAPALAGTAAATAITAIVTVPIASQAMPAPTTRNEPSRTYVLPTAPAATDSIGGYCFLYRAKWNAAVDGPRPVCDWTLLLAAPERERSVTLRPGLDWAP